jgi:glycosyltransferase involved in cell wall biosynthesis
MRILQIVRVGEKMGGIAQVARQYHFLAQKSRELNESPSLTTLADCPSETFLKHFADIGAIHAAGLTKGWRQFSPRAIRLYSNILSSTDLVIAHTGTCMPVLRIITALDLKRKAPLVGIVHNDNSLRRAHRYDGMICLTLDQANRLSEVVKAKQLAVIPNPLGADDFPDDLFEGKISRISPYRANVGVMCNLVPKKNVSRLLDEFACVLSRNGSQAVWHMHIAGDGPEKLALKQKARELGIESYVSFHGWIDAKERAEFFDSIDILWHAATLEPFGLVMVEAAYYGCHVQAIESAGSCAISAQDRIPELEVINANARLGDFASAALARLENHKERRDRLIAARRNAINNYSIQALAQEWHEQMKKFADGDFL